MSNQYLATIIGIFSSNQLFFSQISLANIFIAFKYLLVFQANIVVFGFGCNLGWTSGALPVLKSKESPLLDGALSSEQASWVGEFSLNKKSKNVKFK